MVKGLRSLVKTRFVVKSVWNQADRSEITIKAWLPYTQCISVTLLRLEQEKKCSLAMKLRLCVLPSQVCSGECFPGFMTSISWWHRPTCVRIVRAFSTKTFLTCQVYIVKLKFHSTASFSRSWYCACWFAVTLLWLTETLEKNGAIVNDVSKYRWAQVQLRISQCTWGRWSWVCQWRLMKAEPSLRMQGWDWHVLKWLPYKWKTFYSGEFSSQLWGGCYCGYRLVVCLKKLYINLAAYKVIIYVLVQTAKRNNHSGN